MLSNKKTWWTVSAVVVALIVGIVIGNILSVKSFGRKLFITPRNKINVILDIINEDYVDPINMKDISEGAIFNIVNELDPHSMYIPISDLQEVNSNLDGYFNGIGVNFYHYKDTIVVVNVQYGGPSSQAGLMPGDRIIKVNDSLFVGSHITDEIVMKTMRGAKGSSVKLHVQRKDADSLLIYTIKRDQIPLTTVKAAYEVAPGIGYIKVYDKFSHTTHDEFVQAMTKLIAQGCHSFILDLRSNSGGSYDAAIQIINEFLPVGMPIVYAEGKSFPRQESISDGSGNLPDKEIVVLIDQFSASASEIIAGAIQDNDRGLIIGRRSFGKGLVQNQKELSDGSALRLTIARYYTPSGRNIQRKYELGKSSEYNQDWLHQLSNGEVFHADSIKMDTTNIYHTRNGRTVYGNGGIMPDIFVPLDTAHLTPYYVQAENKSLFEQFAFEYIENNRSHLSSFKDYTSMLDYLKTQPLFSEFIYYAEQHGLKRRTAQIYRSSSQLILTIYARIIQNFFGEEAFFRIYLTNDPMITQAIKSIQRGEATQQAIVERK